jgi:catecholate siderophore receptor
MLPRSEPQTFEPSIGLMGGLTGLAMLAGGVTPALAQTAAPATPAQPATPATVAVPELNVQGEGRASYRRDSDAVVRLPTSIAETPQSITVVPRELMQEQAVSSVREALRNVTGISLAAGEGGFSGDNLTLRGFSARGDFFIDGIRDAGQYSRDPFFMDSIQVLKGPSSIMFGRGSTGGVINQTTRLARAGNFGDMTISAYSSGGVRATGDINLQAGDVAIRSQFMGSRIDVAGRDHVYQSRYGVAPSITIGLNSPTTLTLSYLHQEEENVPDYGIPYRNGVPLNVPRNTFYGVSGQDRERTVTDVFTARAQHVFNDAVTLRNTFRMGSYSRELNATAPRIATTTSTGGVYNALTTPLSQVLIRREPQVRSGYDSIIVNQTEALLNLQTGPISHRALVGIEVGRESSEVVRYAFGTATNGRPNASALNPNYYADAPFIRTTGSDIRTVANTLALYFVDQIRLHEMVELQLGARWDRFEADYRNRAAVTNNRFARTDEAATWRAALVFQPTPRIRTYFAAGTSFNPSAESLTLAANNAQLGPESNITYELGGSWEAIDGLRLTGALFRIEKTNARTSDPSGNLQVLDGVVRVDGVEIGVQGRPLPNWNVYAGYTYLNSEIIRSGNRAEVGREFANVAPNTATLWTTYDLPYGFQIGGGISYVDRRFGNTTNTNRVPSYTRYDMAAAWAPTDGPFRNLRFQVNALNLTDARTYETVYTAHTVPGPGRTVVMSVSTRF